MRRASRGQSTLLTRSTSIAFSTDVTCSAQCSPSYTEWRLNNRLSVQGSYDNINDVSSSTLGNLGVDLRWRLEFE